MLSYLALATASLPGFYGLSSAGPLQPPTKRSTCNYVFDGYNQEGGGSPYQSPINNFLFDFTITEGKNERFYKKLGDDLDGWAFSVWGADYGGSHNMYAVGSYDHGGNTMIDCRVSFDGGPFLPGTVHNHIETNIVSVTTSTCTVTHDC